MANDIVTSLTLAGLAALAHCCELSAEPAHALDHSRDASSKFHGASRFDSMIYETNDDSLAMGRLQLIFRCHLPNGTKLDLAMIRPFRKTSWHPKTPTHCPIREEVSAQSSIFIVLEHVLRGFHCAGFLVRDETCIIKFNETPSRVVPRRLKACIPCVDLGLLASLSGLQPLASRLEVTRGFKTLQVIWSFSDTVYSLDTFSLGTYSLSLQHAVAQKDSMCPFDSGINTSLLNNSMWNGTERKSKSASEPVRPIGAASFQLENWSAEGFRSIRARVITWDYQTFVFLASSIFTVYGDRLQDSSRLSKG
ncbi:hypothetical protein B0H19DRAFT_1083203 [Mycena capillaripes]|nr:hypothetical protein B0H19DRAFT_1083203 [Mycena capillaripes]